MVLVGNEDEDTTCEDEDKANANGKMVTQVLIGLKQASYNYRCTYELTPYHAFIIFHLTLGGLTYEEQEKRTRAIVSSETASILGALGLKGQPLDVRIRKLAEDRDDLGDTVRRLKVRQFLIFSSNLQIRIYMCPTLYSDKL